MIAFFAVSVAIEQEDLVWLEATEWLSGENSNPRAVSAGSPMLRFAATTLFFLIALLAPTFGARAQSAPRPTSVARAENPSKAQRYYERGLAEARGGKDAAAISDFQQSIALDPNRFETYKALDDVLMKDRQWATDVQYWTQYIGLHPNDGRAYCERGAAYSWLHDTPHSLGDAEKACNLGDQTCCQMVRNFLAHQAAARARSARAPARSRWAELPSAFKNMTWGDWAVVGLLACIPLFIIIFVISAIRARGRPKPVISLAQASEWAAPAELTCPIPRTVTLWPLKAIRLFAWPTLANTVAVVGFALWVSGLDLSQPKQIGNLGLAIALWLGYSAYTLAQRISLFRLAKNLMENGAPARGIVRNVSRRSRSWWDSVEYDFALPEGLQGAAIYTARATLPELKPGGDPGSLRAVRDVPFLLSALIPADKVITVLVDPKNPTRNIPYPLCPFHVSS